MSSMLDNQLISLVIATIIAGEVNAGIPNTPIAQSFQPRTQGVNSTPTGYMFKVGDRRYGFPERTDVYDSITGADIHTELQVYETTFQMGVLSIQDPTNTAQYTASDIVNLIAHIMQSDATVTALMASNVGILRISDVRNPYFTDDYNRYEAHPSFDFTLTHNQIITSTTPIINTAIYNIYRI